MARERWFYAKDNRRHGPLPRRQLVESLLALADPRTCLVWRHGLPAWTQAAEVPEIERLLAPFAPAPKEVPPAPPPEPAVSAGTGDGTAYLPEAAPRTGTPAIPARKPAAGPGALVYGGMAGAVLVLGVLAWLLVPRDDDAPAPPAPPGSVAPAPAATAGTGKGPGPEGAPATERPATGFAGWADEEADLPQPQLRRLRGVAGWSGEKLTITLYNGSNWRVTELLVRTSRIEGDQFVDAAQAQRLLPSGGAPVDAAVGELLARVAPDRKRPGVNPADTGPFEGTVGPQPAAYRWKIEAARGYPPRTGP